MGAHITLPIVWCVTADRDALGSWTNYVLPPSHIIILLTRLERVIDDWYKRHVDLFLQLVRLLNAIGESRDVKPAQREAGYFPFHSGQKTSYP